MMTVFQALVRNDLKLKDKHNSEHFKWAMLYSAVGALIGLGSFTWALLRTDKIVFVFSSFPYQFFVLFAFLLPISTIKKEWKQGTANWWFALPYSRKLLLGSKITSSVVRYFKFIGITFLIVIILSLETIILRPEFTSIHLLAVIQSLIGAFIWQLALCPTPLLLGTTLSVLNVSRFKPVVPLVWGLYIVLFNISFFNSMKNNYYAIINNPSVLLVSFVISSILAVVLFMFSTYLLERHVEL